MKDIKINARVIENFNDKTRKNEDGSYYKWEQNEVIKDMPRERFEELQSKGYVEEDKSFTSKNKDEREWE